MVNRRLLLRVLLLVGLGAGSSRATAQASSPQRITVPAGKAVVSVEGVFSRYDSEDFVIGAKANQALTVHLRAEHESVAFRIVSVNGRSDKKLMPKEGRDFSGVLPKSGDYILNVSRHRTNTTKTAEPMGYALEITLR
jgi:hypothetical protein